MMNALSFSKPTTVCTHTSRGVGEQIWSLFRGCHSGGHISAGPKAICSSMITTPQSNVGTTHGVSPLSLILYPPVSAVSQ